MYSYRVLSELGNGSLETFADTRLVASDGASVHHQGPVSTIRPRPRQGSYRSGWWPPWPPSVRLSCPSSPSLLAVSEAELTSPAVGASSDCVLADFAEAETEHLGDFVNSEASPVSERGAGHQGQAEAGTVPLGLVAAPRPL